MSATRRMAASLARRSAISPDRPPSHQPGGRHCRSDGTMPGAPHHTEVCGPRTNRLPILVAPVNAFATKAEDRRPSSSSRGTNAFIASMIVLPFQLGRAFATSRCSPNGTARMIMSASSASRSDLATTVGPIGRASVANASGPRRLATVTSMFLRAKARAWPILPNPTIV